MYMKKIIYTLFALLCIGATACDEDEPIVEVSSAINVTEATVNFDAAGGEGFIHLDSGQEITAVSNVDWCSIQKISSEEIVFVVAQNVKLQDRTATIHIGAGSESQQISISQMGVVVEYDFQKKIYIYPDNEAIEESVLFNSTLPIHIEMNEEVQSWLTYTPEESGYCFSADANTTAGGRVGSVTFQSGELTQTVHFLQYSKEDILGEWDMTYTDENGQFIEDVVSISSGEKDTLLIDFRDFKLLYNTKAVYKGGVLKIYCGQILDLTGGFLPINPVIFGLESVKGEVCIDKEVSCQLHPFVGEDNTTWGFSFLDDGSWNGVEAKGPVFFEISLITQAISYYRAMFGWRMTKKTT